MDHNSAYNRSPPRPCTPNYRATLPARGNEPGSSVFMHAVQNSRAHWQGFLEKEPLQPHALSHPRTRFFVVTSDSLEWFKDRNTRAVPHGRLLLDRAHLFRSTSELTLTDGPCRLVLRGLGLDLCEAALRARLAALNEGLHAPTEDICNDNRWTAAAWVSSLRISPPIASALLGTAAGGEELEALRSLGSSLNSEAAIASRLVEGGIVTALAACILPGLKRLAEGGAATGAALHSKFVEDGAFTMEYAPLSMFFGGVADARTWPHATHAHQRRRIRHRRDTPHAHQDL